MRIRFFFYQNENIHTINLKSTRYQLKSTNIQRSETPPLKDSSMMAIHSSYAKVSSNGRWQMRSQPPVSRGRSNY